mmetsp:Transcript_20017/g.75583  ORF Transcript_20017/g.75583 Transcript_20017/m.75583 type:complete len:218 (-) Transcript_20017:80-733(-)
MLPPCEHLLDDCQRRVLQEPVARASGLEVGPHAEEFAVVAPAHPVPVPRSAEHLLVVQSQRVLDADGDPGEAHVQESGELPGHDSLRMRVSFGHLRPHEPVAEDARDQPDGVHHLCLGAMLRGTADQRHGRVRGARGTAPMVFRGADVGAGGGVSNHGPDGHRRGASVPHAPAEQPPGGPDLCETALSESHHEETLSTAGTRFCVKKDGGREGSKTR